MREAQAVIDRMKGEAEEKEGRIKEIEKEVKGWK